jgi:hypothetical protein
VICPRCESYNCFRSHRRKTEYALSILGLLPWRCADCQKRFYGRRVPLRLVVRAHCSRCGNLELESIQRKKLEHSVGARLATYLGARALRCDYCRYNFASWRPLWRAGKRAERASFGQQSTISGE